MGNDFILHFMHWLVFFFGCLIYEPTEFCMQYPSSTVLMTGPSSSLPQRAIGWITLSNTVVQILIGMSTFLKGTDFVVIQGVI